MGYLLFISERMNTTEVEKAIVVMSMTLLNTLKGKAIHLVFGDRSVQNEVKTAVDWKDVEVDIWSIGWQQPKEAIAQGAKIINITDIPTYSVPNGDNRQTAYGDYANYETQYNRWTPNDFRTGHGPLLEASNPNVIGGGHAVWNDKY